WGCRRSRRRPLKRFPNCCHYGAGNRLAHKFVNPTEQLMKHPNQTTRLARRSSRQNRSNYSRFWPSSSRLFFSARTRRSHLPVYLFGAIAAFAQLASAQAPTLTTTDTPGRPPVSVQTGGAAVVTHHDPTQNLRLVVGLQTPDPAGEEQFLKELHDKKSPQFH